MENSSFVHTFPKETMGYLCYFSVIHQAQLKARFPCVRCCFLCFRYGFFQKQGPQICKFSMGKSWGKWWSSTTFHSLLTPRRHVMWGWIGATITGAWSLPEPASSASQCPVEEVVKLYEDALAFNELQEGSWLLHLLFFLCEKPVFFGPRDSFLVLRIFLPMI